MKLITTILFMLISCLAQGQVSAIGQGSPNQINYQKGGVAGDSLNAVPVMDSTRAKTYGITYRRQGRLVVTLDSNLYYHNGSKWVKLNGQQTDTSSLSARINTKAPSARLLTINGTAQDLSADRSWSVGTVTSIGLSLGTSGTDANVSGSPVTGSGSITLNLPTASASNRGLLSAANWSTFNSKIGGSGTTNFIPMFSSSSAVTTSGMRSDGSHVSVNDAVDASYHLYVNGNVKVLGAIRTDNNAGIENVNNTGIGLITNAGTGMTIKTIGGGYPIVFTEGGATRALIGDTRVLLGSGTDRGTGTVQITGNISVTGANSSNTFHWEAASGSTPSNTATPAGWLVIKVNSSTAYLPYYQ